MEICLVTYKLVYLWSNSSVTTQEVEMFTRHHLHVKFIRLHKNIYIHAFRHGPFDIQGWVFGPDQDIFFGQNRSKIFFSPALRAVLFYFFFITESLIFNI